VQKKNRNARRKIKEKKDLITPGTERDEIVRFARTLGIVILILVAAYFFTRIFVTKDLFDSQKNNGEEEVIPPPNINYDITALGAMFTRPYREYYVFIFSSEHRQAYYFQIIMENYMFEEDSTKLYFADLNSPFNQSFHSEESNPKATNALDLKVGDVTLIKIRNGRIIRFLEDIDEIVKELEVSK